MKNIVLEVLYTSARSAAVNYLSGGIESVFSDGSWDNDAALSGAAKGAVKGAISAATKIAFMGYAVPKGGILVDGKMVPQGDIEKEYADKHGLVIGPYGSVRRSGGLFGAIGRVAGVKQGGVTIGRNCLSWGNNSRIPVHEAIHYLQQVRYGTLSFYIRTFGDYLSYRDGYVYGMNGSMEYEANQYAGLKTVNWIDGEDQGFMDHPGY